MALVPAGEETWLAVPADGNWRCPDFPNCACIQQPRHTGNCQDCGKPIQADQCIDPASAPLDRHRAGCRTCGEVGHWSRNCPHGQVFQWCHTYCKRRKRAIAAAALPGMSTPRAVAASSRRLAAIENSSTPSTHPRKRSRSRSVRGVRRQLKFEDAPQQDQLVIKCFLLLFQRSQS